MGDLLPGIEEGLHCQEPGEYFCQLATILVDVKMADIINDKTWRTLRNKELYSMLILDLLPPKIESDQGSSFAYAWKNIHHDYLVSSERELIFLLIHNKLLVRERMYRIGLIADPYCLTCLDNGEGAILCDVDHIFCSCIRVADTWKKIKLLLEELLNIEEVDASNNIIRMNLPMQHVPGAIWIIGAYISAIWNTRDNATICEEELFGFMKYKFRSIKMGTSSQIETVDTKLVKLVSVIKST